MVFNDTTNQQGIVQEIDFLLGTNSSSYPLAQKLRNINNAYDEVVDWIMMADNQWKFDDDNYDTLPVGETDFDPGDDNIAIPASEFLTVLRVEVTHPDGGRLELEPKDYQQLKGINLDQSGIPQSYNKIGNSLVLTPVPNYTGTLRVYFQRSVEHFVLNDTTKTPGFNRAFHRLLSYRAALDYCIPNNLDKKMVKLTKERNEMRDALVKFYSGRSKEKKVNLSTKRKERFHVLY